MKKIFLLFLIVISASAAYAQSWQDTTAMIEKIFSRYQPGNPGCQLAISRNGAVIFSKAWGMADMEHNVPLTTQFVIEAGSVSKQFTAACILLLEQQGKLSLNDDVRKYIPELPDYGTTITLRNMMQHTSGLKDWGSIAGIAGWPRGTKTYDNDDALYIASLQKTLNSKPGDEFIYSNSNYNLLAVIIKRVSGLELADYSRKYIFEPAGMKHTEWRNRFKKIVPNRAIAYGKDDNYFTNMPNENAYGNGGLLTTAEDLLAWNNYYLSGKLGNPSILAKQFALNLLNNGLVNRYGAGLFIDSARGWQTISHTGAIASYRSSLSYFPQLGLSFAWLSNTSAFDRDTLNVADAVINFFVKDIQAATKEKVPENISISTEKLNSYAGWFKNTRSGASLKLFMKDGKLVSTMGGPLLPVAENIFMLRDNRIELTSLDQGGLRFITGERDTVYYTAVDSAHLTDKNMNDYAGEYYSDETESKFFVQIKDGKVVLHQNPHNDDELEPTYEDGFSNWQGEIYFERDKNKKITGMKISVPRARNVAFKKL